MAAGAPAERAEPEPDCWVHEAARPGPSLIAGTGLITTTDLAAGTVIVRLGGRLTSDADLQALVAESDAYVDSILVGEDVNLVLPQDNLPHFVNHSCEPNLGWVDEFRLATLRDVHAGEELTDDYATSTTDPSFVLWCHCGTYRCRQVIEGTDWKIPQLQQRYAGHWVPYLQRLIDAQPPG